MAEKWVYLFDEIDQAQAAKNNDWGGGKEPARR